jgi:hypothetical protein
MRRREVSLPDIRRSGIELIAQETLKAEQVSFNSPDNSHLDHLIGSAEYMLIIKDRFQFEASGGQFPPINNNMPS